MEHQSACDETGLTVTTIATNALVKTFVSSLQEAMPTRSHCATINIVDCRNNDNKNFTPHITKQNTNDCTDSNWYHSWQVPKHHKTNAWLVKE
jgi:hypothetical protein